MVQIQVCVITSPLIMMKCLSAMLYSIGLVIGILVPYMATPSMNCLLKFLKTIN